ncbi:MAG: hypothetical protein IJ071_10605 [Ruminococcus sp.]|nr:hypothetical protein [Ruminococcus sp.]
MKHLDENYFSTAGIKGKVQQVIAGPTAEALREFCRQEPEFEQAVADSSKTFQDCLDSLDEELSEVREGAVSDLEVYSRAVKYYFATATVHFRMEIDLCGNTAAPTITKTDNKTLSVSLDDLLDF